MVYPQIVCKTFLKVKVTTMILVMPYHFPQEIKTVRYGLQTISYMAPKIWDLVPKEMKQVTTGSSKTVSSDSVDDSVELTFHR